MIKLLSKAASQLRRLSGEAPEDGVPSRELDDAHGWPQDALDRPIPSQVPPLASTSVRRFSGGVAAAAGLAGLGLLTAKPKPAEASYHPGSGPGGSDLVDNQLYVSGNLWVSGSLGIGTTAAAWHITINGPGSTYVSFLHNNAQKAYIGYESTTPAGLVMAQNSSSLGFIRITTAGNVGIGTNVPTQRLDVNGRVNAVEGVNVNGVEAIDSNATAKKSYYAA